MTAVVFDTQALLVFYLGEPGADRVEDYLKSVLDNKVEGHINVVNLAELYYVLSRVGRNVADEKERNLRSFGIKIVPVRDKSELWKKAAMIKAENALSLADAFAAATAITLKATLIAGADPEFNKIKNLKNRTRLKSQRCPDNQTLRLQIKTGQDKILHMTSLFRKSCVPRGKFVVLCFV